MTHSGTDLRSLAARVVWAAALAVLSSVAARAQTPAPASPQAGPAAQASPRPFSGVLTLRDAIQRGVEYNLATMGLTADAGRARGQQRVARSALLPNLTGEASVTEQRVNLAASGVRIEVPNFTLPSVAGPFSVLDVKARVTQSVFDGPARNAYRASQSLARASELSSDDARDRIVLSVGSAYLEAVAAQSRLLVARAQGATADAVQQKTAQQQTAGLATTLDLSRVRVRTLAARQQVVTLEADVSKRKIDLARLTGLPPTDQYDLPDNIPYSAAPAITLEQALAQALARPDVAAATARVRAAEQTLAAARSERLPTVLVFADVGASRAMGDAAHATFAVGGLVRVPLWQGGRIEGRLEQAAATLAQRRVQVDDLKAHIEADVRRAYVDLHAAEGQIAVARDTLQVMRDSHAYVQLRVEQGLDEAVSLAQSRESVASAEFDYTNSVFAHNLAKLALARAIGRAAGNLAQFLVMP